MQEALHIFFLRLSTWDEVPVCCVGIKKVKLHTSFKIKDQSEQSTVK